MHICIYVRMRARVCVYVCIHACMYVCVTTVCIIGREPGPAKFFSLVFPEN